MTKRYPEFLEGAGETPDENIETMKPLLREDLKEMSAFVGVGFMDLLLIAAPESRGTFFLQHLPQDLQRRLHRLVPVFNVKIPAHFELLSEESRLTESVNEFLAEVDTSQWGSIAPTLEGLDPEDRSAHEEYEKILRKLIRLHVKRHAEDWFFQMALVFIEADETGAADDDSFHRWAADLNRIVNALEVEHATSERPESIAFQLRAEMMASVEKLPPEKRFGLVIADVRKTITVYETMDNTCLNEYPELREMVEVQQRLIVAALTEFADHVESMCPDSIDTDEISEHYETALERVRYTLRLSSPLRSKILVGNSDTEEEDQRFKLLNIKMPDAKVLLNKWHQELQGILH